MVRFALPARGWLYGVGAVAALAVATAAALATSAHPGLAWLIVGSPVLILVPLLLRTWMHPLIDPRYAPLLIAFLLAGLAFQRTEGFQISEIIFALYYIPYLFLWFFIRIFAYKESIIHDSTDLSAVFLLSCIYISIILFSFNNSESKYVIADCIAFSLILFYFPIRELTKRYFNGYSLIFTGIIIMASIALARNLIASRTVLDTAAAAWEVARLRVTANEMTLTAGALACAGAVTVAAKRSVIGLASVGFAAFVVGVVITQWRASYVALAIGLLILGATTTGRGRLRLGALIIVGGSIGAALLAAIAGPNLWLIAYGLLDRLLSIGTATTADMSLINRFLENRAVVSEIAKSPVIGHGMGATFAFYDINLHGTWVKPYAHNGYLSIWFKFGIIGLTFLLWFWFSTIWRSLGCARDRKAEAGARLSSSISAAFLISMVPGFLVSAPFATADTVFCFFMMAGWGAGAAARPRSPS